MDRQIEFKMRCLVISNDIQIHHQLSQILNKYLFKIEFALNAYEAHDKVIQAMSLPQGSYNLVIIELDMAITDGYETCQMIKESLISTHCSDELKSVSESDKLVSRKKSSQKMIHLG
jgi:CheY-like chemotaxis protein